MQGTWQSPGDTNTTSLVVCYLRTLSLQEENAFSYFLVAGILENIYHFSRNSKCQTAKLILRYFKSKSTNNDSVLYINEFLRILAL